MLFFSCYTFHIILLQELMKIIKRVISQVPSKPPNNIVAESHVTLTTIPVAWKPIDPHHIHGVLLGYRIRYQAIAIGQEPVKEQPVIEKTVAASTLSLVLNDLEIFTMYRVDVLGYTIMGDGPSAIANAGLFTIKYRFFFSRIRSFNL